MNQCNSVNKLLNALKEDTKLERNTYSNYIAFHGIGNAFNKTLVREYCSIGSFKAFFKGCG